ncbi:MAG: polyprenyl synthetase family protein [Verrucomicrobia bacterium]|nr:polyprenyl synthetase family protein [Verrucomicrobiota bacterium]
MDLKSHLAGRLKLVDAALNRALPSESTRPATIHKAMRYSLFAGGKRLRPILVLAACEAVGGKAKNAMPAACAVEMIHTYSLIHDDLPAMDNDDFRRGKPTSHRVFGEGIAILAGDGLLTQAFEVIAQTRPQPRHRAAAFVAELARAAGSLELIAGQVEDLEGENRQVSFDDLRYIHEHKTAALIRSCCRLGAMAGNATPAQLKALTAYGHGLGVAFQIIDDILDVTATSEQLGKTAGKDVAAKKATYPSLLGLEKARAEAARWTESTLKAVARFGKSGGTLRALADHLLKRTY